MDRGDGNSFESFRLYLENSSHESGSDDKEIGVEVSYGPDGCAMAKTGAFDPRAAAPGGWAWAALDRCTRGTQWHSLDPAYGCALA